MNMPQTRINSVLYTTKAVEVNLNVWVVNTHGRFVWLQRLCERVLRKFGQQSTGNYHEIVRHGIDTGKIADRIMNQLRTSGQLCAPRPSKIYMGPEQFHEMSADKDSVGYMSFGAKYRDFDPTVREFGEQVRTTKIFDIEVQVLPWMDGVLVV